jgi:hypothetical protein
LFQCRSCGQRTWFAEKDFEVVVEVDTGGALGHRPFMAGDLGLAVVDDEVAGVE